MARLSAFRRLERIGFLGQGHCLLLLSSAIPARTITDKSGVDDAARQLTRSNRSIYPQWSEHCAGRLHPSDYVRCRTRDTAPAETRCASDQDEGCPYLRTLVCSLVW